LPWWWAL